MTRVHKKRDGLLMISDSGQARYMTLVESILYWLFKRVPRIGNEGAKHG